MANENEKFKENIPGPYYVDTQCIACDACKQIAPNHFSLDEEDGHAFVHRQPSSPEEKELCEEALESCPVEAIGNNGEPLMNQPFSSIERASSSNQKEKTKSSL